MSGPDLMLVRVAVIAEALRAGEATYWTRRAEALEGARPRPEDFHGRATREELSRRWRELTEAARACRSRAALCAAPDVADLAAAEAEVARALGGAA